MSRFIPQGMGWIPDLPDPRDYTYRHEAVLSLLDRLKRTRRKSLPAKVDLRADEEGEYFTPPADQGPLNSSSAFAVLSLVEYFERRVYGRTFEGSALFLYKTTRDRVNKRRPVTGDTGADLRTTLKILASMGVPPEDYWPYDIDKCDKEPSPFVYNLAKRPGPIQYFRLDEPNSDGSRTWQVIQSFLAASFPVAFGFPVPASLMVDANIPYRPELDSIRGGQAVVAVGYETNHFGRGQPALLIRSSWGSKWGDNGNGWLPISYVLNQIAIDFWAIVSEDWIDSGELTRPPVVDSRRKANGNSHNTT